MFLQAVKRGKNDVWRYLLTILLVILAYVIGQVPVLLEVVEVIKIRNGGVLDLPALSVALAELDFKSLGIDLNYAFFLLLLMFIFAFGALWFGVRFIHQRSLKSLITPLAKINWAKIFFAFSLWIAVNLLAEAISYYYDADNYIYQLDWHEFLPLLAIALLLLPIQTSFEELLLRGYLMQGIANISAYRWIPLVLTSTIFGLVHGMNPEVQAFGAGVMMTYYIGIGLFLGIITLMDDSLELALGIHAATNIYGALMLSFEGSVLQTPAIFRLKTVNVDFMIPAFLVLSLLFLYIFAKKYKWKDWHKIYGPVNFVYFKAAEEQADDRIA